MSFVSAVSFVSAHFEFVLFVPFVPLMLLHSSGAFQKAPDALAGLPIGGSRIATRVVNTTIDLGVSYPVFTNLYS